MSAALGTKFLAGRERYLHGLNVKLDSSFAFLENQAILAPVFVRNSPACLRGRGRKARRHGRH